MIYKIDITIQSYAVGAGDDVNVRHDVRLSKSGFPESSVFDDFHKCVLVDGAGSRLKDC